MNREQIKKALEELRKNFKKRNFNQTVDLIVNLREFDVKRNGFNTFVTLPHKIKDKKVAGFLEKESKLVSTIKKENFPRFKEKKDLKNLVKEYDFFISNAKLRQNHRTGEVRLLD